MGNYQKFRGDPESKLFYLLDGLVGGINTEFSDDASSDIDFESIVNFDVDKLGTLTKRNGFGKIKGLGMLFQRGDIEGYNPSTDVPTVYNITDDFKNVEEYNDNLVYVKLLKNDNNCFRNLAAFDTPEDYQKMYGFQNNEFKLLIITTKVTNGVCSSSKAWYYYCKLPELEENSTLVFKAYQCELPVIFNWNKTLMNMDSIEYYNDIWFTNNDKALVRFDRGAEILSNVNLDAAFHYVGIVEGTRLNGEEIKNEAYTPSLVEVTEASLGLNSLTTNPLYDTRRDDTLVESIQGAYLTTKDLGLLGQTLIVGEPVYLGIQYTGGDGDFSITAKNGDTDLGVNFEVVSEISQGNTKFYKLTFSTVPDGEVEITIEKTDTNVIDPYRLYVKTGQPSNIEIIKNNNIGNCGMCMMSDNRVAYYREDTIFFSDVNRPDYLPFNSYLKLPLEPTDRITKICYFKGVYIVFTKESIYKLMGTWGNLSSFACEPVNTSLGCHAGHTVVPIEDTLYFASPRGLYALKSSTFIEGMQNLVELDIKVKKLTSDFTLYEDELANPAMRFNGINEKAYALRYRDKYMLFFNSSYEKGDYAAKNNLDVLVYDYTLKSFTTYSFLEKPTFLFIVDNALQTLSLTQDFDETIISEQTIIDYDLDAQETGSDIIIDSSDEGNNATVEGDLIINQESYALGDFNYIDAPIRNNQSDFSKNLNISMDIKIGENQTEKTIFEAIGTGSTEYLKGYSGEIRSEFIDGYQLVVNYSIRQHVVLDIQKQLTLTLTLNRETTDVLPKVSGVINLKELLGDVTNTYLFAKDTDGVVNDVFENIEFSADFSDALSVEIFSDTLYRPFSITDKGDYVFDLNINLDLTSYDPYSYYTKGAKVSGTNVKQTEKTWIKFGIPYSVVAYDGYARFTITKPYVYSGDSGLGIGARTLTVNIAGKSMSFSIPKISGKGNFTSSETKYVDITYPDSVLSGDGKYTVTVASSYNIKGNLSGTYYANLTSSFSLTLPTIKLEEGYNISETKIDCADTYNLEYVPSEDDLRFTLQLAPEDVEIPKNTIEICLSDDESSFSTFCIPVEDINERHTYSIKRTSNSVIEVFCDEKWIGQLEIPEAYEFDRNWNSVILGTSRDKINYLNWEVFDLDFGVFRYNSLGNTEIDADTLSLIDKSENGNNGTMYGYNIIEYDGINFSGVDSYIKLPELPYAFSKGFIIETDLEFKQSTKTYKIFDAATSYGNADILDKNNSINISVTDGVVSFNIMTKELEEISVSSNKILVNKRYKLKCVCEVTDETGYTLSIYIDDNLDVSNKFKNKSINSVNRQSCFIGKSNNQNDGYFKGIIHTFKIMLSSYEATVYRPTTVYEFDTAYSDFGKPIYYELQTKGINLKYPQHIKKLKHIFIKAKGGYKPNDLIFELHTDGYLVNDPKSYYCYVDETGKVVYDYTEIHNLTIDERVSVLGNMTLNNTRLGEGNYQTIKMVIPSKGKNFKLKMYGENKDYMSLESFGLVAKLGKVKQD